MPPLPPWWPGARGSSGRRRHRSGTGADRPRTPRRGDRARPARRRCRRHAPGPSSSPAGAPRRRGGGRAGRSRSEEHTSELQSLKRISYAVFCLQKKNRIKNTNIIPTSLQTYNISITHCFSHNTLLLDNNTTCLTHQTTHQTSFTSLSHNTNDNIYISQLIITIPLTLTKH